MKSKNLQNLKDMVYKSKLPEINEQSEESDVDIEMGLPSVKKE